MANIVLATMGSLGDLHPMIAVGRGLASVGHKVTVATWSGYEANVVTNGFAFRPLRPDIDATDRSIHRKAMDAYGGPEYVIRELIMPSIGNMYDDLAEACTSADLLISGEIVYAAAALAEVTGIKWISTSLSPLTMFSSDDPGVPPQAPWAEVLRPLPAFAHRWMLQAARLQIRTWIGPYRDLRRRLGLNVDHDPIVFEKFSPIRHLAMFSRALAAPQADWPSSARQTGFCFFDGSHDAASTDRIASFIGEGEPPIVFTLGSAAVLDAGNFFNESVEAAKRLGRRALLLYGRDCDRPNGLNRDIAAFEYAPYSDVFPHAACIVHQGGVGTTAQALRAGVPQLIMPYSHDQFDNAARARRAGVAEVVSRDNYNARDVSGVIERLLSNRGYREKAAPLASLIRSEDGVASALAEIGRVLGTTSAAAA
ncbi:MAG: glycosyltransferase family 1 protein [Acidobacteria bacterium]|nr:glycosyltransferase family 1 protein [Acidobacteriota bacterium]MCW5948611.1 glycosyltransferase family 1 protein [Pyrinomonadaceae bacterium]